MRVDPGQNPAKNIVLLDDAGQKPECRCGFEDLALVDHRASSFQRGGTHKRQAVTSLVQASAGSSFAYPCVRRERQAVASSGSSRRVSARNPMRLKIAPFPNRSA